MKNENNQNNYSLLYEVCNNNEEIISDVKNPLFFFSEYINYEKSELNNSSFEELITFKTSLEERKQKAYNCFILEISLLEEERSAYLNIIVSLLISYYDYYNKLKRGVPIFKIVTNIIFDTLKDICYSDFQKYLDNENRNRLSKWHSINESIKSFTLKKLPENKWFQKRILTKITNGYENAFISDDTSFVSFKALFEGKYVENKVNWIDNKSSLCYFIKSLINSKLIVNPKNKHWQIVSEFFLFHGETIEPKDLLNQKVTSDKRKKEAIDNFINSLKNYS